MPPMRKVHCGQGADDRPTVAGTGVAASVSEHEGRKMTKTILERFWDKVMPEPNSGCWLWTGAIDATGYSHIHVGKRTERAHRISYELFCGPIPKGLHIDHLCRVRCCVNPAHLEPVTALENSLRGFGQGVLNSKKTHCPQGHAYTKSNTIKCKKGKRTCRECQRSRSKGRWSSKMADQQRARRAQKRARQHAQGTMP